MRKIIITTIIICIINLSGTSLILWKTLEGNSGDFYNDEYENLRSETYLKDLYVRQNISESIHNHGSKVNHTALIENPSGKPLLICRYSNFGCNKCIDFAIDKLKESFTDFETHPQIKFIASEYKGASKTEFENGINLKNENLGIKLEETRIPFYFILIDGSAKHIFIPDELAPEYTDTYLGEIKNKYFRSL